MLTLSDSDAGRFAGRATYRLVSTVRRGPHHRLEHVAHTIAFGEGAISSRGAGTLTLTLAPTRTALRRLRSAHSLRLAIAVTFTPTGGLQASAGKTVLVRYRKPAKVHHHR